MARIVLNNGFKPFAFPGCDIFSPDLNLHLWQGCWETGLADSFAGSEAARTSQPDGLSPEDSELLLSEDSARQREAVVKEIHKANESSRELLALVERYAGRSAEELWTTILTQKQREQLIMYAARDVCTLPSIGEGKRDLVPELMLWELAADEGRRFWSIVKTVIGAPTEAEFSYPRVRYAPYDNKLAEGYSKDALPASRAMRAWRVWNLELRHNFISALVFRILLYLCYNAKADRNNNRSIGAGDYLIEDDLDILAGYSTRALKDQSFGPAPTVAAIAKRLANECSKCHKTRLSGQKLSRCSAYLAAGRKDIGYCSAACQKGDWKHHKQFCGKLATENVDMPTFLSSDSAIPCDMPRGLQRQIAAFEADPNLLWTVGNHTLRVPDLADLEGILNMVDKPLNLSHDNSAPTAAEDARRAAITSVEAASLGDLAALQAVKRWMSIVATVWMMDMVKEMQEDPPLWPADVKRLVMAQFRSDFELTTETVDKLVQSC